MRVAIATDSSSKIRGIKNSVHQFLKEDDTFFFSASVSSGVPEQPFNNLTYQGALNRAKNMMQKFPGYDFYISCEAGIEESFPNVFFSVQVVCILAPNGKVLWGKSSGWSIPPEDIEIIKNSNLDIYLRKQGISSLEKLLGTSFSRSAAVAEATWMALASGNNKKTVVV